MYFEVEVGILILIFILFGSMLVLNIRLERTIHDLNKLREISEGLIDAIGKTQKSMKDLGEVVCDLAREVSAIADSDDLH